MPIRPLRNIHAFGRTFLVVCPQCSAKAQLEKSADSTESDVVLSCSQCELSRQWQRAQIEILYGWKWFDIGAGGACAGYPVPAGFEGSAVNISVITAPDAEQKSSGQSFLLWLQTPCDGENLWLLNRQHLDFAELLLRDPDEFYKRESEQESWRQKLQWVEGWIEEEEDTEEILRCIQELRRNRL